MFKQLTTPILKPSFKFDLPFTAPAVAGSFKYKVVLLSTVYAGLDQVRSPEAYHSATVRRHLPAGAGGSIHRRAGGYERQGAAC